MAEERIPARARSSEAGIGTTSRRAQRSEAALRLPPLRNCRPACQAEMVGLALGRHCTWMQQALQRSSGDEALAQALTMAVIPATTADQVEVRLQAGLCSYPRQPSIRHHRLPARCTVPDGQYRNRLMAFLQQALAGSPTEF